MPGRNRVQSVRIKGVQDRRKNLKAKRPWVVRWVVEGREFSRSHPTRAVADRHLRDLRDAYDAGEVFDRVTGDPAVVRSSGAGMSVYAWARTWMAQNWGEWAPRTRASHLEELARFVILTHGPKGTNPPSDLRSYVHTALRPDHLVDAAHPCERWLNRHTLQLGDLDAATLAQVETKLGEGIGGAQLGPATAARYRKTAKSCIRRAVELGMLPMNPWPVSPRGRASRKAMRVTKAVNVAALPAPDEVTAILAALPTHQPGSRMYQVMTAVAYGGGLRPSEVVVLRPELLSLPSTGWGEISVWDADDGEGRRAEPKTTRRQVPIPPQLVAVLQDWITQIGAGPSDLLFRTRSGARPTQSNWGRALHRAAKAAGCRPVTPYTFRHAAATTWLAAGVPLAEVARRLGHSVETLVSFYAGALPNDAAVANERIEAALAGFVVAQEPGRAHAA